MSTESELLILAGTFGDEPFRLLATHHLVVAGSGELDPATTAGRRVSCGAQIYEIKRHIQTAVVDEIRNHALLNEGPGGTMKVESKMSTVAKGLPKRLALNNASESAIRIMLALVASDQNTRHEWDEEADAAAATQARACDSPPPLQQHRSWQQKFLERCEQELDVPLLSETARHRFWTTARQNHWRLPDRFNEDDKVNGLDYLGVRAAMIRTLRKVDPNAAPFIDGIPPAAQKLFLTSPDGWESCMALVTAIDSDMMHVISHRNNTDPNINQHTSLFLALTL